MAKKFSVADIISKERYEQAIHKSKGLCDEWSEWIGNINCILSFGAPCGGFNLTKFHVSYRKNGGQNWNNRGNKYIYPHDKTYEQFVKEIDAQEWSI